MLFLWEFVSAWPADPSAYTLPQTLRLHIDHSESRVRATVTFPTPEYTAESQRGRKWLQFPSGKSAHSQRDVRQHPRLKTHTHAPTFNLRGSKPEKPYGTSFQYEGKRTRSLCRVRSTHEMSVLKADIKLRLKRVSGGEKHSLALVKKTYM